MERPKEPLRTGREPETHEAGAHGPGPRGAAGTPGHDPKTPEPEGPGPTPGPGAVPRDPRPARPGEKPPPGPAPKSPSPAEQPPAQEPPD